MRVVDLLALLDTEEEDDDVDDAVADVDIRQVQKLAVHWLASLVSEDNNKTTTDVLLSLSLSSKNVFT